MLHGIADIQLYKASEVRHVTWNCRHSIIQSIRGKTLHGIADIQLYKASEVRHVTWNCRHSIIQSIRGKTCYMELQTFNYTKHPR